MKLESFNDVLASMKRDSKRPFHLLLGNGFSVAFDKDMFSYNAIHNFVADLKDADLTTIFKVIETSNFEVILQNLDHFSQLIDELGGDPILQAKVDSASAKLKKRLLEAVKALHPEHVFKIPEERSKACAKFLNYFLNCGGGIFSTNYDLLLYWVLMRNAVANHGDGCGRELENDTGDPMPQEDQQWSDELYWGKNRETQNVFYLHGALPFFDTGVAVVKEEYDDHGYLLEKISARMEQGEYPIFVTAGDGQQKLKHITHNQYLTYCYDRLCRVTGSLVTFGFGFGEYDTHIIEAINRAARQPISNRLRSVYIGVFSGDDQQRIEQIGAQFHCKLHIFDAKTAPIWGETAP